jgi:hypothetical protein
LCFGRAFQPDAASEETEKRPAAPVKKSRLGVRRGFGLAGLASLFVLISDVSVYYLWLSDPLEKRILAVGGGGTAEFPKNTGERLNGIPVSALDFVLRAAEPDADYDPALGTFYPAVEFELRKKGHSKELVLDQIYLTVTKFENAPTDFFQSYHLTAFVPEEVVCVTISKKPTNLPWVFPITNVIKEGEAQPYSKGQITFKDDFASRVKVIVQARDAGIYTFSLTAEFSGDTVSGYKRLLTDKDISFVYVDSRESRPTPKPDEEIVVVGQDYRGSRKKSRKAKVFGSGNSPDESASPSLLEPAVKSRVLTPGTKPGQTPTTHTSTSNG